MSQAQRISRAVLLWAGLSGALGVILGSFGAHGLEGLLAERGYEPDLIAKRLDQWDVAVRYHLVHTVLLVALAAIPHGSDASRRWTAILILAGLVLFSGSLYALVLLNMTAFGMVAPLGGLSWIVAWLALIWVARSMVSESTASD